MKNTRLLFSSILLAALGALPLESALACASCGCSLSSDAAMGYSSSTGWQASLQFDFLNQNQLRSGTGRVSAAQVAGLNSDAPEQEVEKGTINRYVTLGLSYAPSAEWNFRLLLPYVDRSHTSYGAVANPLDAEQLSGASVSSLGDAKLIASYQGLLPTRNLGVQLGVKLPTGHYGGPNATASGAVGRNPASFSTGPNAQPTPALLDTSLQAGTGSTDLILGSYYYQPVSQDFDAFVNGQFQSAIRQNLGDVGADFRPGNLATINVGLRYEAHPDVVPQLQLNLTHRGHDQGALADSANTGGSILFLSPGVSVNVANAAQLYAFVQLPVYSRLDGYQLFPRWTATFGISHAF